jgi:hypothetical protein
MAPKSVRPRVSGGLQCGNCGQKKFKSVGGLARHQKNCKKNERDEGEDDQQGGQGAKRLRVGVQDNACFQWAPDEEECIEGNISSAEESDADDLVEDTMFDEDPSVEVESEEDPEITDEQRELLENLGNSDWASSTDSENSYQRHVSHNPNPKTCTTAFSQLPRLIR